MWCEQLTELFTRYIGEKQAQRLMDYDDTLLHWARVMEVPELAADIGSRFDQVLVDEYQDTNRLQASILLNLCPNGRGLAVVGDDAQSIYSFRAATIRNILEFPDQFQPPAHVVALERNYRSTQPILSASNAVINLAEQRYRKELWSVRRSDEKPLLVTVPGAPEQARYVTEQVLENRERGAALKAQAVLVRAGHHSAVLELELSRCHIPFMKVGGLRFLDAADVRDVLAVLRLAVNPRDHVAACRVLLLVPGIGPKIARRLIDGFLDAPSFLSTLERFSPTPRATAPWAGFVGLMRHLVTDLAGWPAEFEAVRRWYEQLLELTDNGWRSRLANLEQLAQIAGSFPTRQQFLTDLMLDPPHAGSDEAGSSSPDEDYLTISTIHSAKGLEWTSVFVLNVVDGCIPLDVGTGTADEIEEERRLLYVAMTRAKDHLHLLVPRQFDAGGQARSGNRHVAVAPSRFIPPEILQYFDQLSWPRAGASRSPDKTAGRRHKAAGHSLARDGS
jgi:DNA helicase-2/ATP-dependent DNA helicase PcrA